VSSLTVTFLSNFFGYSAKEKWQEKKSLRFSSDGNEHRNKTAD
jgi:hypothetical protein